MSTRGRKQASSSSSSEPTTSIDQNESSTTTTSSVVGLLKTPSVDVQREVVKVNNASVTDMKHACDDALKRFLSRPDLFNQIYTHTDVRLALGWASVFVAAGTGFYGYKVDFEKSKPVVWAGLILYILLTVVQTLYAYFVEGDTVFVGKRKTLDKRIVTERLTIASSTTTTPSPSSTTSTTTSSPSTSPSPSSTTSVPQYTLTLSYVRSTAGGKSLLGKGRAVVSRGFNSFFDEEGRLDVEGFEGWVGGVVGGVVEGKGE